MWDEILAIILPPAIYLSFAINILDGSRWSYFGLSTPFNEMAPLCIGESIGKPGSLFPMKAVDSSSKQSQIICLRVPLCYTINLIAPFCTVLEIYLLCTIFKAEIHI